MAPQNNSGVFNDLKDEPVNAPFEAAAIFVSNEVREIAQDVLDLSLTFIVANIGIFSNIFVIIVFAKQGYKESMNISMTAISMWDLLKCISMSIQRMSGPVSLFSKTDAGSWDSIMTVVATYFNCIATYVSSALAAYVAVERCICVTLPFSVKTILTPKVTFIAMVTVSSVVFGCFCVMFGIYDIVWIYDKSLNKTVAIYRYNAFYQINKGPLMLYYNLSAVIWPMISFIVIVICTAIIFYQLQKASKFRSGNTATASSSSLSDRDRQVIKMLLVIIVIYVANLTPRLIVYIVKIFIPEFTFLRKLHNTFIIVAYIVLLCDAVNGTVNMFVFLSMSSNFRATAKALIGLGSKTDNAEIKKR